MELKRKKWTEEEERSLIDKYADMRSEGIFDRLRTREKKFRPIAAHVNAVHHAADPVSYPFLWSWKDACTKVQNMRHQYLLVKQKLLSALRPDSPDIDWSDGLSLWPNFLSYKHVFGDAPLKPSSPPPGAAAPAFPIDDLALGFDGDEVDEGFDYDEVPQPQPLPPPPPPPPHPSSPHQPPQKKRKKRPERRAWAGLAAELERLREREARLEERESEREREQRRRENAAVELEEAKEREWGRAWMEMEERERRRREEDREWEEGMERRRAEWNERVEAMLTQHRAEMESIHGRILHDQQSIVGQLLGIVSHWAGPALGSGLSYGTGIGAGIGNHHQPYLAQMVQNLHHMNGMVPGENRVGGVGQEDQFIVDG